jgi:hypothetical protein
MEKRVKILFKKKKIQNLLFKNDLLKDLKNINSKLI